MILKIMHKLKDKLGVIQHCLYLLLSFIFISAPLFILTILFYFQLFPAVSVIMPEVIPVVPLVEISPKTGGGLFGWIHSLKGSFFFRLCPFYSKERALELAQLSAEQKRIAAENAARAARVIIGALDEWSVTSNWAAVTEYQATNAFLVSVILLFISYGYIAITVFRYTNEPIFRPEIRFFIFLGLQGWLYFSIYLLHHSYVFPECFELTEDVAVHWSCGLFMPWQDLPCDGFVFVFCFFFPYIFIFVVSYLKFFYLRCRA
jgi:hypothetical protein